MSACAIKQWGHGTPCVKEGGAAKEMAAKLAQIKAERDRQDAAWHEPTTKNKTTDTISKAPVGRTSNGNTD
jgi:hypothetical protein